MRTIGADSIAAQAWHNGTGRTRELLRDEAPDAPWRWRISLADIDADGPFSAFPGVQRWFAVVAGAGVELVFASGAHQQRSDDAPLSFDGAAAPGCRLLDGPTRDLNLMLRAGTRGALQRGTSFDADWPLRGRFDIATRTLHWALPPGPLRDDSVSLWIGVAP